MLLDLVKRGHPAQGFLFLPVKITGGTLATFRDLASHGHRHLRHILRLLRNKLQEIGTAAALVVDLVSILANLGPEPRRSLLGTVGLALRSCHEQGLIHRDLNARNIIVMQGEKGWNALVVDLDRASFARGPLPKASRLRQLRRLYRSLAKEKVIPAVMQTEDYLGLLLECLGPDYEDKRMKSFLRDCRTEVLWHRLFWR